MEDADHVVEVVLVHGYRGVERESTMVASTSAGGSSTFTATICGRGTITSSTSFAREVEDLVE